MLKLVGEIIKKIIQKMNKRNDCKIISANYPIIKTALMEYQINESMLRTTCLLSALIYTYEDTFFFKCICNRWNIERYIIDSSNSQLIYGIFKINDDLVITFKGSTTFDDYLTDLEFVQIEDEFNIPGKLHKGFYELIFKKSNYRVILDNINSFQFNKLYITGHSLGGALSTIFYSYIKTSNAVSNVELINFGAPTVGNRTFAKNFNGIRFVNENDIVPKIIIPIFYKHIRKERTLGKKRFWKWSIDDHAIVHYLEKIDKIISR